ncbi:MAG: LPS export ABC transporter periplasmic protein LptC [Zoogloeaceae bacterium]|nr:LPS export ABC transporter periplasmic protein LptC [Zoogloeaceae bacterium]
MVLCILAGLSFWLEQAAEVPLQQEPGKPRHEPDTLADTFILYRHDANGRLQYKLAAPHMEHYPDDDSTRVTRPSLIQFRPDGPQMILEGETALVTEQGKRVFVQDNVVVTRTAFGKRKAMKVETTELTILPEEGIAFNQNPVHISEGSSWMAGVGLKADNNKGIFQLQSRVRAKYVNPPKE